jgi:serine/threonine protein kinase
MENIKGETYVNWKNSHLKDKQKIETVLNKIAEAVRHLWTLPLPPGTVVGPLENNLPVDRFFGDSRGRRFKDVPGLEDWINMILRLVGRGGSIDLRSKSTQICHCDLAEHNIMLDNNECILIIDWGFSGIYPRCFEEWGLVHQFNRQGLRFAKALHQRLFDGKFSREMTPLGHASNYLLCGRRYTGARDIENASDEWV